MMEIRNPKFEKYLFVCENEREEGICCHLRGRQIRAELKQMIKEKNMTGRVRVSRTKCLGVCREGPNVLLMPDDIWFSHVTEGDCEAIVRKVLDCCGGREDLPK